MKLGIKLFAVATLVLIASFLYVQEKHKAQRVPIVSDGVTFLLPEGWKIIHQEKVPAVEGRSYDGTSVLVSIPDPKYTVQNIVEISQRIIHPETDGNEPVIESLPNGALIEDAGCAPGECRYIKYKNKMYEVRFGLATINGVAWDLNGPVLPGAPTEWTKYQIMSFLESFQSTK